MEDEKKKVLIEIGDTMIWVNGWSFDSQCGVRELACNIKYLLEDLGIEVEFDR